MKAITRNSTPIQYRKRECISGSNTLWIILICTAFRADAVSDIINRFNKKGTTDDSYCYNTNVDLFDLTVTVKGRYSTMTKSTTFYMNGYTNASPINAIDMNKQSVVF